jgi:hypothetical protein
LIQNRSSQVYSASFPNHFLLLPYNDHEQYRGMV